jgi:hypothetical protein
MSSARKTVKCCEGDPHVGHDGRVLMVAAPAWTWSILTRRFDALPHLIIDTAHSRFLGRMKVTKTSSASCWPGSAGCSARLNIKALVRSGVRAGKQA